MNKSNLAKKWTKIAGTLLISGGMLLSGCVDGITVPHLHVKGENHGEDIDKAILYAESWRREYRKGLGNQAGIAPWLGIGLIPLGAATAGLGLVSAGSHAFTILGLTTTTGYATGTWLQNTPQQRAYIAGHNAIGCAVDAVLPFDNRETVAFQDFKGALKTIEDRIGDVEKGIANLRSNLSDPARAEVALAEASLQIAKQARSNGVALELQAENAGQRLVTAVDRIVGQIDTAIVANQPDIQSLGNVIADLGNVYTQINNVPVPAESEPSDEAVDADGLLEGLSDVSKENVEALIDARTNLDSDVRKIASLVNLVNASTPLSRLAECGADVDGLVAGLAFDPPEAIAFDEGKVSIATRVVTGGKAPYAVKLVKQVDEEILKLTQIEPFGPAFVVEATDKLKADMTNAIYVIDGTGRRQFLQITIKAAQGAAEGNDSANFTGDINKCKGLYPQEMAFLASEKQCKELQRKLCVHDDAIFGARTRDAIKFWQIRNGEEATAANGKLGDADQYKSIMKDETILCPPDVVANIKGGTNYALIFRHAEKADNDQSLFQAAKPLATCTSLSADNPDLTQKGADDAACIGRALSSVTLARSYTSSSCRTSRTALRVTGNEANTMDRGLVEHAKEALDGTLAIFSHMDDIKNSFADGVGKALVSAPEEAEAFVIDPSKVGASGKLPADSLIARIKHHEWEGCKDRRETVSFPGT